MAFFPTSAPQSAVQWLRWLPVAALLVAIAGHAVLMQTVDADRQAGSAFAMFSSVDFANSRQVVAHGLLDGETFRIWLPAALTDEALEVRRAPTDAKAAALASSLAQLDWSISDGQLKAGDGTRLDEVLVRVFGLTDDSRVLERQVFARGVSS